MLVDFAVKNYLSFKREIVFSMLAANSVKENESDGLFSNVHNVNKINQRILKVASVYGANGSGKSNFIKALTFFKRMIINSYKEDNILKNFRDRQFLYEDDENATTGFEVNLIIKGIRYRYGFEVENESIVTEWLYIQGIDNSKESYCFKRDHNEFKTKGIKAAKQIIGLTRENSLFLSTLALSNVSEAKIIKDWFENDLKIISGVDEDSVGYTAEIYKSSEIMHNLILDFIKIADFGIKDIKVEETLIEKVSDIKNPILRSLLGEFDYENTPTEKKIKELNIFSTHAKYKDKVEVSEVSLPFNKESIGTIKAFSMIGPWFDSLLNGKTLIVDEFGASLHTKLSFELIRLFQSMLNKDAQLILTTHDTNLLRKDLLRRDQIWFVEKSNEGVSDMYSLVEYKINQATSVRNDASFEKDYLQGKYGAIPYFGNIEQFVIDYGEEKA